MKRIIISRTDAIGDVVLTLPLAGIIKERHPNIQLIFFGKTYTKPVIDLSTHIDEFINFDEFDKLNEDDQTAFLAAVNADHILHVFPRKNIAMAAKKAGIKNRVGTSHRLYHWFTCNNLLNFSRKNSELHEAQLNVKLLNGIKINASYSLSELTTYYGFIKLPILSENLKSILHRSNFNLVIHPRSHGSAREWGLHNFKKLVELLSNKPFTIFISGSPTEQKELAEWIKTLPADIHDLTGKLSLTELNAFINTADGIVAGSTGPLHIGAALGKHALGIFPPIKPMHAGRWAPVGTKAQYVTIDKSCIDCKSNPSGCKCLQQISPQQVAELILQWRK